MGFTEILIIAVIALIFLGPEKFPEFAKLAVRTVRDLRGYMDEVKTEVAKEMRPVSSELKQLSKYDPEKYIDALSPKKSEAREKAAKEASAQSADMPVDDDPYAQPAEGVHPYGGSTEPMPDTPAADDAGTDAPPVEPASEEKPEEKFPD